MHSVYKYTTPANVSGFVKKPQCSTWQDFIVPTDEMASPRRIWFVKNLVGKRRSSQRRRISDVKPLLVPFDCTQTWPSMATTIGEDFIVVPEPQCPRKNSLICRVAWQPVLVQLWREGENFDWYSKASAINSLVYRHQSTWAGRVFDRRERAKASSCRNSNGETDFFFLGEWF